MMNFSLLPLLVCTVLCGTTAVRAADPFDFTWKNCGGSNDDVSFSQLSLSPMPLKLPGSAHMTYAVDVRQLTSKSKVSVDLVRVVKIWFGGKIIRVPVPCFVKYGSCEYDLCNPVKFVKDLVCPESNCQCPPEDGHHQDDVSLDIDDVPYGLSFITDGNYEAKITIKDADGNVAGCVEVTFSLGD
ncbi:uncharacterized protein LOC144434459 [Glandiceps talaboti]